MPKDLRNRIFTIADDPTFNTLALEVYQYQKRAIPVYREFINQIDLPMPTHWSEIPCIPISCFKHRQIIPEDSCADFYFESSGTGQTLKSRHWVTDISWYQESLVLGFERFYGSIDRYAIVALLPHYLEQGHSSLVYMVEHLMQRSGHPSNGFYLRDFEALRQTLLALEAEQQPTILFGVSYALLDFIEHLDFKLHFTRVFETGGMKGRREELSKSELHRRLKLGFGLSRIESEYGMTELFSQAYLQETGFFKSVPWMKVFARSLDDPFTNCISGQRGALQVIDLANIHSCAFIATEDLGRSYDDGSFELLGRCDAADLRGCNLMVDDIH